MEDKNFKVMKTLAVFMGTGDALSQYFDNIFPDNDEMKANTELFQKSHEDFIKLAQKIAKKDGRSDDIAGKAEEYGTWWDRAFDYSSKTESTKGPSNIGECSNRILISIAASKIVNGFAKDIDDISLQLETLKIADNLKTVSKGFQKGLEHYSRNKTPEAKEESINKAIKDRANEDDDEFYALACLVETGKLPTSKSTPKERNQAKAKCLGNLLKGIHISDLITTIGANIGSLTQGTLTKVKEAIEKQLEEDDPKNAAKKDDLKKKKKKENKNQGPSGPSMKS